MFPEIHCAISFRPLASVARTEGNGAMDLRKHLIESDPVSSEPELSALDAQMMRQRVILEARNAERESFWEPEGFSRAWWLRPIAVAAGAAACRDPGSNG